MPRGKNFSADDINTMVKMLGTGSSSDEIAEALGREVAPTRVRISRLRKQVGKTAPKAKRVEVVAAKPKQQSATAYFVAGAIVGALLAGAAVWLLV